MSKYDHQISFDGASGSKPLEVTPIPASKTAPVRLQATADGAYTLTNLATNRAPQQIQARRRGRDLLLSLDDSIPGQIDLILENFYGTKSIVVIGVAEDGSAYRFIPNTASSADQLDRLSEGGQASHVLGGSMYALNDASLAVAGTVGVGAAGLIPAAGLGLGASTLAGGALLLGAAALGGGGGGGSSAGNGSGVPAFTGPTANLAATDDTGSSNSDGITSRTRPRFEGTALPGAKVQIRLDDGTPVEVTADGSGKWSWVPETALGPGPHTLTTTTPDAAGVPTTKTVLLNVDTSKLSAGFSSNFNALNNEPTGLPDARLNINESKNGVLLEIVLSEKPGRALSESDLLMTGGTIQTGSFTKVSDLRYSLLGIPTPDSDGNLLLKWSPAGQALTDVAGNPLDNASTQQLAVAYDLHRPQFTLNNAGALEAQAGQNLSVGWTPATLADQNDLASVKLTLLGQTVQKSNNLGDPATLIAAGNGLDKLTEGYYTLTAAFGDASNNESIKQAVLKVNRGTLQSDVWNIANVNQQVGNANNELFINRKGDQSLTGNGGADTFVWLGRDAGTSGAPDVDTITDFVPMGTGQSDKIDIKDLLGANIAFANLPKYVQVASFDSDANSIADSTRISISRAGAFTNSHTAATIAALSDQVILLQGVVTDLNSLLPNNLLWQAAGAPILA